MLHVLLCTCRCAISYCLYSCCESGWFTLPALVDCFRSRCPRREYLPIFVLPILAVLDGSSVICALVCGQAIFTCLGLSYISPFLC